MVLAVLVITGIGVWFAIRLALDSDPFMPLFVENCAVCHGESFEGSAQGPALVGRELLYGDSVAELAESIAQGFPDKGMPGWAGRFDEGQVRSMAILIGEQRVNRKFTDFKTDMALEIPAEPIETELASFRLEVVADGLSIKPFSIASLPDGSLLVTEKVEGLTIVSPDGSRSEPITGTPITSSSGVMVLGLDYGLGWLLDVAPHFGVHLDPAAVDRAEDVLLDVDVVRRLEQHRLVRTLQEQPLAHLHQPHPAVARGVVDDVP